MALESRPSLPPGLPATPPPPVELPVLADSSPQRPLDDEPATHMDHENRPANLKFMLANVQGLLPTRRFQDKPNLIGNLISHNSLDFACITESWLRNDPDNRTLDEEININDYILFRADRRERAHGGVCAFVHQKYRSKLLLSHSDKEIEVLHLHNELKANKK